MEVVGGEKGKNMGFEDKIEQLLKKMQDAESDVKLRVKVGKLETCIDGLKNSIIEVKNSVVKIHERINECQENHRSNEDKEDNKTKGSWRKEFLKREWDIVKIIITAFVSGISYLFIYYWPTIDKAIRGE